MGPINCVTASRMAMMTEPTKPDLIVKTLLRELAAVRGRIDNSQEDFRGGETALMTLALSKEVEYLCRQATVCSDRTNTEAMLAKARDRLDEIQRLFGVH